MESESSNNFNKIYTQFDWKVLQHVLLIRPSNNNSKMATVIAAVTTCCRCKGTWMAETL